MKKIEAVKIGNVVNISIDGKLYKKNCANGEMANKLFATVLATKEDPNEINIKELRSLMNEKIRIAYLAGLETDPDNGEVFLAGFNTPLPMTLVEVIKEYYENNYPLTAIKNFWKLLMINPDRRIRESLFNFIKQHDFVLTDKGYMVVYKTVDRVVDKEKTRFAEFISNRYLHVKKTWKESPKAYVVYKNGGGEYNITSFKTATKYNEKDDKIEVLGNLAELYDSLFNVEGVDTNVPVYTDKYTNKMRIELGKPVQMERKECDSDPAIDCSYGLHVGATKYVETFGGTDPDKPVLVCLVNPAHVVAVPNYDHSKMRVSEYFPFALATYTNGKIDIVENPYYEDDYQAYELEEVEKQIEAVKAEELPIGTAINAEPENRPMAELMKMLENRLVDLDYIHEDVIE